jgi:hypothetical protein
LNAQIELVPAIRKTRLNFAIRKTEPCCYNRKARQASQNTAAASASVRGSFEAPTLPAPAGASISGHTSSTIVYEFVAITVPASIIDFQNQTGCCLVSCSELSASGYCCDPGVFSLLLPMREWEYIKIELEFDGLEADCNIPWHKADEIGPRPGM